MKRLVPTLFLCLAACDAAPLETPPPSAAAVWVANGGNFSDQNGSVSRVDLDALSTTQGSAIDGFVQAIEPAGQELLVLVNTFSGGRIDILAQDRITVRASIRDIAAPRGAVVSGSTAYVTTFGFDGSGSVLTVDLVAGTLVGQPIPTDSYPEGLALVDGSLWIAAAGFIGAGTTATVIDPVDGSSEAVDLGCDGPRDVIPVADRTVAITCLGKTVYSEDFSQVLEQTNGQVVFVDATSRTVQDRVPFDTQLGSTGAGQAAATSDMVLSVLEGASNRIHRIALDTRQKLTPWTLSSDGQFVGVSGITYSGEVWVVGRLARAAGGSFPDYTASGQVILLDAGGQTLGAAGVGPAPTHISVTQ